MAVSLRAVQYAGDKKRLSRLYARMHRFISFHSTFLIQHRPIKKKWNNSRRKTCLSSRFYDFTAPELEPATRLICIRWSALYRFARDAFCMTVGGAAIDDLWQREIAFLPLINLACIRPAPHFVQFNSSNLSKRFSEFCWEMKVEHFRLNWGISDSIWLTSSAMN